MQVFSVLWAITPRERRPSLSGGQGKFVRNNYVAQYLGLVVYGEYLGEEVLETVVGSPVNRH